MLSLLKFKYQRNTSNSVSTATKIVIYSHLGIALLCLLWLMFQPALQQSLIDQSALELYETILKDPLSSSTDISDLSLGYQQLKHQPSINLMQNATATSLWQKLFSIHVIVWMWALLSVLLSILLLLRFDDVKQALWLLPLLIGLFAVLIIQKQPSAPNKIFPSKAELILYAQNDLEKNWQHHLICKWARELPSTDPKIYLDQFKKGQFFFNVARLRQWQEGNASAEGLIIPNFIPPSWIELSVYFIWNVFVAIFINRKKTLALHNEMA